MALVQAVLAIRHGDVKAVQVLLEPAVISGGEVNAEVLVEGSVTLPQEQPLFPSTLLLEACRCGDERILKALLARSDIDPNRRTGALKCTAFADSCARGDADTARALLSDPRVDPTIGDLVVAHPVLYACMSGDTKVIELCASRGLLTDALEESLVSTATANGQLQAVEIIESHYVQVRPLSILSREQQEKKIRFVCSRVDTKSTGFVPSRALPSIAADLGSPLSPEELREALSVLLIGGAVGGNAEMHVRVDDIVAMWLLD